MSTLFNMSDLKETLGVTITAPFIANTLGIEPDEKDKRSSKYAHETVSKIIDAYIEHLQRLRDSEEYVHAERGTDQVDGQRHLAGLRLLRVEGDDW